MTEAFLLDFETITLLTVIKKRPNFPDVGVLLTSPVPFGRVADCILSVVADDELALAVVEEQA